MQIVPLSRFTILSEKYHFIGTASSPDPSPAGGYLPYLPSHAPSVAPNQAFWIRPCPARFVSMLPRMHLSVLPVDLRSNCKKGKGFPYSILSVGPGADPDVQAVSLQVTVKSSTRR